MAVKTERKKRNGLIQEGRMDVSFLALVLILLVTGLVMLFSASYAYSLEYYNNSFKFILRQLIWAAVGLCAMFVLSKIDYHFFRKFSWLIYIAIVALLGVMLVLPPMVSGMNVKRWFPLGPITFQPSEIAKFAITLLFAHLISANYKKMSSFGYIAFLLGLMGLICGLIFFEPHISATILVAAIGIVLIIIGGIKKRFMIIGGFGALGVGAVAIFSGVVSYGSERIKYWIDPWLDASGKGFQTIQSLLAIGSGGILGRGLGQSRQKYLWVPEPHNDFIFSIVCEELGLIGALVIIILFALLVYRGFSIAMRSPDKFGSLLAVGLTFQVGLQAMLNIFVVTNTMPNTGISLPFFSYGGTSLFFLLAEMGIVLSISRASTVEKN